MKIIGYQEWQGLDSIARDYWTRRVESHELTIERVSHLEIYEDTDRVVAIVFCRDHERHLIYNPLDEDVLRRRVPLGSIGDGTFHLARST